MKKMNDTVSADQKTEQSDQTFVGKLIRFFTPSNGSNSSKETTGDMQAKTVEEDRNQDLSGKTSDSFISADHNIYIDAITIGYFNQLEMYNIMPSTPKVETAKVDQEHSVKTLDEYVNSNPRGNVRYYEI